MDFIIGILIVTIVTLVVIFWDEMIESFKKINSKK